MNAFVTVLALILFLLKIEVEGHLTKKSTPKLKVVIRTSSFRDEPLTVNELGWVMCSAHETTSLRGPQFDNFRDLSVNTSQYMKVNKTRIMQFFARKIDNKKFVHCKMNLGQQEIRSSAQIFVYHKATNVDIKPPVQGFIDRCRFYFCNAEDGYPTPKTVWNIVKGPQNAERFYQIIEGGKLIFFPQTPAATYWVFNCSASNQFSNVTHVFHRTISFTIFRNDTTCDTTVLGGNKTREEICPQQCSDRSNGTKVGVITESDLKLLRKALVILQSEVSKNISEIRQNLQKPAFKDYVKSYIDSYFNDVSKMKKYHLSVHDVVLKHVFLKMERNEKELTKNIRALTKGHEEQKEEIRKLKVSVVKLSNELKVQLNEMMKENAKLKKSIETIKNKVGNRKSTFVWQLSNLSRLRRRGRKVLSEVFYTSNNVYKMQLELWPKGHGSVEDKFLTFYLFFDASVSSKLIQWPFETTVTITLINKQRNIYESLTKDSKIFKTRNWTAAFHFNYDDLVSKDIVENDSVSLECKVDIK